MTDEDINDVDIDTLIWDREILQLNCYHGNLSAVAEKKKEVESRMEPGAFCPGSGEIQVGLVTKSPF